MTCIFNLRPPKPKLSFTWGVDILFWYFEQQGNNCLLPEIILTQKLIILMLLLGARRLVTIKLFSRRMASSSKPKRIDVNIDEIIRRGCWKNQKNLFKYYDREITEYAPDDIDFNRICRIYIGLPTSSYLLVVLTFPHRTDKARMNTKIKRILTKYEA